MLYAKTRSCALGMAGRLGLLLVVVALLAPRSGWGGPDDTIAPPEALSEIRDELSALVADDEVPSAAVGVAHEGDILWQEAFGWADRDERRPATPHTPYSIASVTKPMTATAIMRLAENGDLDLNAPVDRYLHDTALVERAGSADDATVRRVLDHTSGLPTHYQFFYDDESHSRPPMEESIRRYGVLTFPPGVRHQYSNIGYGVLDQVIRTVADTTYAAFMHDEVFAPLGMEQSTVGLSDRLNADWANRYDANGEPLPFYDFDHRGGSAVFSSVHDLLRFGMLHVGTLRDDQQAILSDDALSAMRERSATTGENAGYGLGWSIRTHEQGAREVYHSGSMGGVRTLLLTVPDEELIVTLLLNGENGSLLNMVREIAHTLLPNDLDTPGQSPPERPASQSAPIGGTWEGRVVTHADQKDVTMHVDDEEMTIRLGEQSTAPVHNVHIDEEGFVHGIVARTIDTDDTNRHPHLLRLLLKPDGDRLYGAVTAISQGSSRPGYALSSYLELERE